MNIRRFTARSSRDALVLARQALGEDAVVLSTKPSPEGVEMLAMAPEGMQQIERMAGPAAAAVPSRPAAATAPAAPERQEPSFAADRHDAGPHDGHDNARDETTEDVARLSMSTLSFQDYVRERMLRRRQDALKSEAGAKAAAAPATAPRPAAPPRAPEARRDAREPVAGSGFAESAVPSLHDLPLPEPARFTPPPVGEPAARPAGPREPSRPAYEVWPAPPAAVTAPTVDFTDSVPPASFRPASAPAGLVAPPRAAPAPQDAMLAELRSMKGLIEERFGALAYIEKLNRQPGQVRLIQKLLGCGFSPALIKRIGDGLPMDVADETAWAAGVLERNLQTAEAEPALEDLGGVYALVGATGVGKTTTTAKIAAAFATKYGAANLGLITLDAYRIGAHEQLRAYGRILGVPVHTAHDRASLEDLLELLAAKKMVLIDTAGMAQRDTRTRELLEMLSHRAVRKLLVVNAASQGETIEDVMIAYHAPACAGIVLSKMDEAVKLGPALDAAIRMKSKVIGVANGQRVPEDWHRLGANALVARALRAGGSSAYRLDAGDLSLVLTAPAAPAAAAAGGRAMPAAAALRG